MSNFVSLVVTSDNVYYADKPDSHNYIIQHHKLETGDFGKPEVLRVYVSPENGDWTTPWQEWTIKTNQEILPRWYQEGVTKQRVMEKLEQWYKEYVVPTEAEIDILDDSSNKLLCLGHVRRLVGGKIFMLAGKGRVDCMLGSSVISVVTNNASVNEMYDFALIGTLSDSANVGAMFGDSKIRTACGQSYIYKMADAACVEYAKEETTIRKMISNSMVNNLGEKATVEFMQDHSAIRRMINDSTIHLMSGYSVVYVCSSNIRRMQNNALVYALINSAAVDQLCEDAVILRAEGSTKVNRIEDYSLVRYFTMPYKKPIIEGKAQIVLPKRK